MNKYIAGLDLSSVSVNTVIINSEGKIVYESKYTRHDGQSLKKAREIFKKNMPHLSFRVSSDNRIKW